MWVFTGGHSQQLSPKKENILSTGDCHQNITYDLNLKIL